MEASQKQILRIVRAVKLRLSPDFPGVNQMCSELAVPVSCALITHVYPICIIKWKDWQMIWKWVQKWADVFNSFGFHNPRSLHEMLGEFPPVKLSLQPRHTGSSSPNVAFIRLSFLSGSEQRLRRAERCWLPVTRLRHTIVNGPHRGQVSCVHCKTLLSQQQELF